MNKYQLRYYHVCAKTSCFNHTCRCPPQKDATSTTAMCSPQKPQRIPRPQTWRSPRDFEYRRVDGNTEATPSANYFGARLIPNILILVSAAPGQGLTAHLLRAIPRVHNRSIVLELGWQDGAKGKSLLASAFGGLVSFDGWSRDWFLTLWGWGYKSHDKRRKMERADVTMSRAWCSFGRM